MANNVFLGLVNNVKTFVAAITQSTGATDANKIISTDSTGRIHVSFMPVGVEVEALIYPASEALAAGDFLNIWSNGGVLSFRKADASNARPANAFTLSAVANGQQCTGYLQGNNTSAVGAFTPGTPAYLSNVTAGTGSSTAPTLTSSQIYQELGYGSATGSVMFEFSGFVPVT